MKNSKLRNSGTLLLWFFAFAGASPSFGDECIDWVDRHPEWIWCDDFETDSGLGERYEDVSERGLSPSTEDVFGGNMSLRMAYDPGQVGIGWITKVDDAGFPDHLFVRWYHKFGPGFDTFPPKMARVGYRERFGDWNTIFRVHAWLIQNTGELTADVSSDVSTQAPNGWLPLKKSGYNFPTMEWVALEVEVKLNDPGATNGHYRFWVNDELVIEALNVDLRGPTDYKMNEVMFDGYWNGGAPTALVRYFDNIVISRSKIGLYAGGGMRPKPPTGLKQD